MPTRIVAPLLALALLVAACGDSSSSSKPTPVPSNTPIAATATATRTGVATNTAAPSNTPAATTTTAPTNTAVPTTTAVPTNTAVPTDTAAPTPDVAACVDGAFAALRDCVVDRGADVGDCYEATGVNCNPQDGSTEMALRQVPADVRRACPDDATVRAAGFGAAFTVDSLIGRLQSACSAEVGSLAGRSFGGPQGAALTGADSEDRTCLFDAYGAAKNLLSTELDAYHACITANRDGSSCDTADVRQSAAAEEAQLALAVGTACASLPTLVSIDPPTYAARAGAQARCLSAISHGSTAPLSLDCGPRDGLIDTPRGEYVQVVLDSATYGTRCGDGSPYAFWIRLAPEGSPVDHVVVGMQGGGVCIFGSDCATRPADLFEAMNDQPETGGTLSNDPEISPFADWTKVYLPYCNQDVFIGGGTTSNFDEITVQRYGAVNVRAAMRYVRDVLWRELDRDTAAGYRSDQVKALFGGFSAGGFGTIYNYHWVLDDLEWPHTAAYPDAGLALDNGQPVGVAALGVLLISDTPPLGWGARNYLPSYCTTTNCGVGPVVLEHMSPRLLQVPEQQMMILSNQVDQTQVETTFFSATADWVNAMRTSYCDTHELPGVNYFLTPISDSIHVISPRPELYTAFPVDGMIMRDWLASVFTAPTTVGDQVQEGTLVQDVPGVLPFPCAVAP